MNEDFDLVWSDIRQQLMPGTLVRYWSSEKGYAGDLFRIGDVDGAAVIIRHGQMGYERRVPKGDFRNLFAIWEAYNRGKITEVELGEQSGNARYIVSILQWRDVAQSGPAPTQRVSSALRQSDTVLPTGLVGHDDYGKSVLYEATEGRATLSGPSVEIDYGSGEPARIDATVADIAVEIESRGIRQVRGALLDLICHPYPKKLLVLLPDQITNRGITAGQCRNILNRFCAEGSFRILVLKGSGGNPQLIEDTALMATVLADLRSR